MSELDRLKQLETMYEGFVAQCNGGCGGQCSKALDSIRRQIKEAK